MVCVLIKFGKGIRYKFILIFYFNIGKIFLKCDIIYKMYFI